MSKRLLLSATCTAALTCTSAFATMTANLPRGESLVTHDVAGRSPEVLRDA